MKLIKKISIISAKILASIVLLALLIVFGLSFSPIYNFADPKPFTGEVIFNPYSELDPTIGWKRANFHTHTKVDEGINECPFYPDQVLKDYKQYGYDILSFSNHQALTTYPGDSKYQIWVYEHGYNLLKFHQLVFGSTTIQKFDNIFPILTSQKQYIIDILNRNCDFIVFNHPDRTFCTRKKDMVRLTGYKMIEGDSGKDSDLKHWDEALSAGRYSFNLCSDDNHNSQDLNRIARRCSWLNTSSVEYSDIKDILLKGCFYSMNIPNFGDGDLEIKIDKNSKLPEIKEIGLRGDTIYIEVSQSASSIEIIGQDGVKKGIIENSSKAEYKMGLYDTYIRFTVKFPNGVIIYSNPFAKCSSGDPYQSLPYSINWLSTIGFNSFIVLLIMGCVSLFVRCWSKKRIKTNPVS